MFGDNMSAVNSATKTQSKLHTRHNTLSFHRVQQAIAFSMIAFFHAARVRNPADILSKHWAHGDVWKIMQPLMFWKGGSTVEIDAETPLQKGSREQQVAIRSHCWGGRIWGCWEHCGGGL
jgi:hypothetical protein